MIGAPHYARRAWVRFLRRQGASIAEIAQALNLTEIEAARLTRLKSGAGLGQGATTEPASIPEKSEKGVYP